MADRMEAKTKLLDQVRTAIRLRHLSIRTEEAHLSWIRRFILFHQKRHPQDMGAEEVRTFLSHLAVYDQVAASTQNIALNALLFLYRHVLHQEWPTITGIVHAKRPRRLPAVFTQEEGATVLAHLKGTSHLMASAIRHKYVSLSQTVKPGTSMYERVPYVRYAVLACCTVLASASCSWSASACV